MITTEASSNILDSSSIYYWAHYDFFNNTKFGEPVPGTVCDEKFSAWKQEKGRLRSPVNTLIYKKEASDSPTTCHYRFVTDKRIFARILLTVESVNFTVNECNLCIIQMDVL